MLLVLISELSVLTNWTESCQLKDILENVEEGEIAGVSLTGISAGFNYWECQWPGPGLEVGVTQ